MLTVSLSLSILMLIRGASPTRGSTYSLDIGPHISTDRQSPSGFFNARDLRIHIIVDKSVDLNITNSDGLIVFSANNIDSTTEIKIHLDRRGSYKFILYNPTNSSQEVRVDFTEFNFETDLMQGAIAFSIIGVSLIIVEKTRGRIKHSLL